MISRVAIAALKALGSDTVWSFRGYGFLSCVCVCVLCGLGKFLVAELPFHYSLQYQISGRILVVKLPRETTKIIIQSHRPQTI